MRNHLDLDTYLQLFRGREDYFAAQGKNWYTPVEKTLNEYYVCRHLEGDATFGIYVLNQSSCCRFVCIDIDIPKNDLSEVDFKNPSVKYNYLKNKIDDVQVVLSEKLGVPPESILLEDTGGRGYHMWVFFTEPIQGKTVFIFGEVLKNHLNFEIEFFPKQDRLTSSRKFGNLIKLPLGIHKKYDSFSFFFSMSSEGLQPIVGQEANIVHLQSIVLVVPGVIERAIETFASQITQREESIITNGDI